VLTNVTALVERGRAAAEALMVDACTVARKGEKTLAADNIRYEYPETQVYSGKLRIRAPNQAPWVQEATGQVITWSQFTFSFPVAESAGLRQGDVVTITACELDPGLVGMQVRLAGRAGQTHSTARRWRVEEAT